jgi:uncharacterized protein (DUF305 family)
MISHAHKAIALTLASTIGLTLPLAACSGEKPTTTSTTTETSSPSFNDADVAFVVDAGSHLLRTLTASQMVAGRSSNPAVIDLADEIIKLNGPQVDKVASWVRSWGRQGGDLAHDTAEHGDSDQHGGFTEAVLDRLASLQGRKLDHLFLTSMSEHLAQGQTIWASEVDNGTDPGATRLANQIADEESKLIDSAKRMLTR